MFFGIIAALFGDSETSGGDDGASFSFNLPGLPAVVSFGGASCYYWLLEETRGQTVGKTLAGLRVVRANGTRAPTGPLRCARCCASLTDSPLLYLLGFIAFVSSQRGQRIGDIAAATLVVRK